MDDAEAGGWRPGRTAHEVLVEHTSDEPVKRGRGRPRTRPVDEERRLILDAALTVLSEQGYGGATIERVARTAGVQRRSVYEQFGDRELLFVAAVDDAVGRMLGRLVESLNESAELEVAELLRHNIRVGLEVLSEEPATRAVLLGAYLGSDDPPSARARAGRQVIEQAIAAGLRAREAEVEHAVDPELYAATLVGLSVLMGMRMEDEGPWSIDRLADYLADLCTGGRLFIEHEATEGQRRYTVEPGP